MEGAAATEAEITAIKEALHQTLRLDFNANGCQPQRHKRQIGVVLYRRFAFVELSQFQTRRLCTFIRFCTKMT